jgi:tetratricopeptide (TPR) repeat protein
MIRSTGVLLVSVYVALGCATAQSREADRQELRQARSHFDLGVDHMANARTALAIRELLAAQKLRPKNPRTQYALGDAYMRKGKVVEAEAHLKKAIAIWPEFHDARLHLSALYILTGEYAKAMVESQVLVDDPTFPAPWRALTNHGWALFKLGETVDARASLEEAHDLNRTYWPTLLDLGILENQEGRRLEAIERFRQLLALRPGPSATAETNYRLAEIYVTLGKRDRAVGHLLAAVKKAPEGRWGKKSEEYLKLLR